MPASLRHEYRPRWTALRLAPVVTDISSRHGDGDGGFHQHYGTNPKAIAIIDNIASEPSAVNVAMIQSVRVITRPP